MILSNWKTPSVFRDDSSEVEKHAGKSGMISVKQENAPDLGRLFQ